jgi:hypothetical protein
LTHCSRRPSQWSELQERRNLFVYVSNEGASLDSLTSGLNPGKSNSEWLCTKVGEPPSLSTGLQNMVRLVEWLKC